MPRSTRRRLLLALVPVLVLAAAGESFAAGWVLIGRRAVTDRIDHDTFALPGHARYDKLRLQVKGPAVQFHDLKVHFANGGTEDVTLRDVLRGGTRVIDLKGRDRDIERIEVWYDAQTRRHGRGSSVEIWGRRD